MHGYVCVHRCQDFVRNFVAEEQARAERQQAEKVGPGGAGGVIHIKMNKAIYIYILGDIAPTVCFCGVRRSHVV